MHLKQKKKNTHLKKLPVKNHKKPKINIITYPTALEQINSCQPSSITCVSMKYTDRAADMHKENMKKKRRDLEQASLDAASDLLDTDSNATFAMVLTS